jgi:hypothetical protein
MADVIFRKLAELTNVETASARAYGAESGLFHLACQADHSMALTSFQSYQEFCHSGKLAALKRATTSCFELTAEATVYSGHGSGTGVIGGLGHSDPVRFEGMIWQYKGFTSTTSRRDKAEQFLQARAKSPFDAPILLEFRLSSGFRLLPMEILGADSTHEAEFLLPPSASFQIMGASHVEVEKIANVLHFTLKPV